MTTTDNKTPNTKLQALEDQIKTLVKLYNEELIKEKSNECS